MTRNGGRLLASVFLLATTSLIQAEEASGTNVIGSSEVTPSIHHINGNVGIYTDYLFRGISYGRGRGAFQAAIDYSNDHGFFIGLGYTNVDKDAIYGNTYETDVYAGFKKAFTSDLAVTAGFITYYYPQNNHYVGQHPHVAELNLAIDYRQFNVKYSHSLTDWFGVNTVSMGHGMIGSHEMGDGDSKGSHYWEGSYTTQLPNTNINCVIHVGHQSVKNYHIADYTDYSIGLNKDFTFANVKGWNAGISYVALDADHDWYVASDGYKTAENKFFGYIRLNM
ncbi:MAG: TorF family putative porin [Methylophilus sp.]|uniref:TorF family putative porin n=1 Tax=Methylophilus sp. TaxID=29541 RepID=UPI003FA1039A